MHASNVTGAKYRNRGILAIVSRSMIENGTVTLKGILSSLMRLASSPCLSRPALCGSMYARCRLNGPPQ
jgi:hypothetical protein